MTAILALDMANKTGWAENVFDTNGTHEFGFMPAEVMGARFSRMSEFLDDSFGECHWESVYYEQAHQRGGAATRSAMALICAVEQFAYARRIPIYPVHTATLKKHATGSGRAQKFEIVNAAKEAWPEIEIIDDNHADALWLLDYAENQEAAR